MGILKILVIVFLVVNINGICLAEESIAVKENVDLLKKDIINGRVQIGKTRLYTIKKYYGTAPQITVNERKIAYDYPDLRIEFRKKKLLKDWEYDTFKGAVYTDDIDKLRSDLEADKIVGNNITYSYIARNYGQPTDFYESDADGDKSIYYYGDIKLIFENYATIDKYKMKGLANKNKDTAVYVGNNK